LTSHAPSGLDVTTCEIKKDPHVEPPQTNDQPPPQIHVFRGALVVLDSDVAQQFGVTTRALNQQVKRNIDRFGDDFAFQLGAAEFADLKSQSVTSSHGGRRKPPWVFTEHGVVMAATVLRSDTASEAARFIVKTFVATRRAQLPAGRNLPAHVDPRSLLPITGDVRHGLLAKLDAALGRVLDAIVDPASGATVRTEAHDIAAEGLRTIKDHLKRQGLQNEKTLAEVHKLLKEAEALDADIAAKRAETDHRRLAYVAKQLRIVIEVQRYLDTGSAEGLLAVLKDLGS
jgi:hypothetical protein